ncbi:MAG: two-component regulator propeller domain-containing protein [Bacteroidota bacterium]
MTSYRRFVLLLILFVSSLKLVSQQIAIGQWRDELPYFMCISVAEADPKIYTATPYALFYFDKSDNNVQRINKINGLSDIGINAIRYSKEYNTLVVAYDNANIDLLKGNTIINISDIKRAPILGNKTINNITIIGKYAYLACGFGIVVLDIDKEEIHDTYYIGLNGGQVNVLSLARSENDTLFAATEKGIYVADANSPNLANFATWHKDVRMDTTMKYNTIASFKGQVVVNQKRSTDVNPHGDTLYRYAGGIWNKWVLDVNDPVYKIEATYDVLCVTFSYFVRLFNPDFSFKKQIYSYFPGNPFPLDAIVDKDQICWIGDHYSGLIAHDLVKDAYSKTDLSGPLTSKAFSMTAYGNDLYIAPGGRESNYGPIFNQGQVYHFDNTNWINTNLSYVTTFFDVVTIAVDPSDPKRIFAGSWTSGLAELYNGELVNKYVEYNSTLRHHTASDTSDIRIGGTAFDTHGNLWVNNTHNNWCISKKTGGTWTGYNVPIVNEADLGQMIVDKNDQKWVVMRFENTHPNALLVFKEKGAPGNSSVDQSRLLNSSPGTGNIPGSNVYAIAEDRNGLIWVGTEKGVGVFFNPENMFVPGENIDAQQILVQQGSYVQYLLENEMVTAIAVDGANQKWIGTDRGGVFLFSPDGTKEVYHFTMDNSPLFSDRITSLSINSVTGEVYIATDKGVISFKSTATEGTDKFSNVYAYPNPVKEGYTGYIAIKGLVQDAEVKITDVSGRLIFATKALGGQAIWDGKSFDGKRANTGVYMVFANNTDGSEKIVTKILIVN